MTHRTAQRAAPPVDLPDLSLAAARALLLAAQGLEPRPNGAPALPASVAKREIAMAIRQMGALQIDTIHIVARSHLFVLWSRLGSYDPALLDELLADGALFEYWSHAACLLPIEEYPFYRRLM